MVDASGGTCNKSTVTSSDLISSFGKNHRNEMEHFTHQIVNNPYFMPKPNI